MAVPVGNIHASDAFLPCQTRMFDGPRRDREHTSSSSIADGAGSKRVRFTLVRPTVKLNSL